MNAALKEIIFEKIKAEDGLSVGDYMALCLGHPQYGYYNTRDPFGAQGDFTTAPEISQMFGEMVGAWIVDGWFKMGSPNPFVLLECGPGRGTLMKDIMRAAKSVPAFQEAVQIHLLEMSPVLRQVQAKTLEAYQVKWHDDLKTVPEGAPVIVVGNEFLDALPVAQYTYGEKGWRENRLKINSNDTLRLCVLEAEIDENAAFPVMLFPPNEGDQVEVSHEQNVFINDLSKIVLKQGGIGIFVDYGFTVPVYGTSLQGVMNHQFVSPFEHFGECDITAHVNFAALGGKILENELTLHGPVSQGDFLTRLGIVVRAEHLHKIASGQQGQDINSALERLVGKDTKNNQMGELFKVVGFSSYSDIQLEGFA